MIEPTINGIVLEFMRNHLESPELFFREEDTKVIVESSTWVVHCQELQQNYYPNGEHLVQLLFTLHWQDYPREVFQEAVVGLKKTLVEAVFEACHSWFDGMFQAFTKAFAQEENPFMLSSLNLEQKVQRMWNAYEGNLRVRANEADAQRVIDFWKSSPWLQILPNAVATDFTEYKPYWISVTRAEYNGEVTVDCWLNNQHWPYGQHLFSNMAFPQAKSILRSVRWCLLCVPQSEMPLTQEEYNAFLKNYQGGREAKSKKPWWKLW